METLNDLLADRSNSPDTVVFDGDTEWPLDRLRAESQAVAAALREVGVEAGQPVGVMLPDGADVVAALFGVWAAGAVYTPLNPRLSDPEVVHALETVHPAGIVTTSSLLDRFDHLPAVERGPTSWTVRPGRVAGAARHDPDIALASFTSGTTGRPKPVLLRHAGVIGLLDSVIGKLRGQSAAGGAERAPMPNLIPVSLSLWAGIYQVLFALRVGAPIVVLGRFTTAGFVDAVRRFGIRSTVLPPAAMTMLADDPDVDDLSPLKYVRSISAPLSPLQARRFRDQFGISVLNGYGQTELGGEIVGWSAADSKAHGEDKLGSVGRPHAQVSLRVVGRDGDDLGTDEAGELLARTPVMSAGYAEGGSFSERVTDDGWLRTGDVARIDADGFVWIEGRVSDMINRGGLKVFPDEVAEVLRLVPEVADAAVVGVPDDRLGEVPWGFVVLRDGARLDPAQFEEWCREHLAPYKVPVHFEAVAGLPRNDSGKVLSGELIRRATADTTP